jgi:hypothetical protein
MSVPGTTSPLLRVRSRLLAGCKRPVLSTLVLLCASLLILTVDFLLPMETDMTAFLILPLMGLTVCRGPKPALAAAWGMAVLKEAADRLRWGDTVPWSVTPVNIIIWGTVATALVLLAAAAMEAQRLREAQVQLRTLQQTMVTVQDIVRNRLQLVTMIADLLDGGILPQQKHVVRLREAIDEMLALLDRLSRVEEVTVDEVAMGLHAVRLAPEDEE